MFASVLFAVPTATMAILLVTGAQLPAPAALLLLVTVAALAVNRYVLFPTEQAATAEVAVFLAAVVAFSDSAPWTGPLVLGLLAGPLDMLHWEHRSFLRMAYNAGSRGLAVLAASVVVMAAGPDLPVVFALALACAAFVLVDASVSTVLLGLRGMPVRAAMGHVAVVDRGEILLALAGAAAGTLALDGWWLGVLLVAPLAFVPERWLLPRRGRRRERACRPTYMRGRGVVALACVVSAGAVGGVAAWSSAYAQGVAAGAALFATAAVLGLLLGDASARPAPVAVAAVTVVVVLVPSGTRGFVDAALTVVVMSVAASTVGSRAVTRAALMQRVGGVVLAIGASWCGIGVAVVARGALRIEIVAMLSAVAVLAVAALAARPRRARIVAASWGAPFVGVSLAIARSWRPAGVAVAVVLALWMVVVVVVADSFGALPWTSAWSRSAGDRTRRVPHRVVLVVASAANAVSTALLLVADARERVVVAWAVVVMLESIAAIDLIAIRQWRFATRGRLVTATVVAVVAIGAVLGGDGLARGNLSSIAGAFVGTAVLVAAGWSAATRADRVRTSMTARQGADP